MSDVRVRELERRALTGDLEARKLWRAEVLRVRDPRVLPLAGDVVRVNGSTRLVRGLTGWQRCPWDGVAYREVPGYCEGYGCPVCKGLGTHHIPVPVTNMRWEDGVALLAEVDISWHKVLWLYGEEQGSGLCYHPLARACSVKHWRRWSRRGEIVRVAEERAPADVRDI